MTSHVEIIAKAFGQVVMLQSFAIKNLACKQAMAAGLLRAMAWARLGGNARGRWRLGAMTRQRQILISAYLIVLL